MTMARRLRAAALAALLALHPAGTPVPPLATIALSATAVVLAPDEASARASTSRSSGGYSRPSASRTPSVGSSSRSSSGSGGYSRPSTTRTPSTSSSSGGSWWGGSSGGYARPGNNNAAPSVAAPPQSAGDRAMSQQGSADALNRYRAQQDAAPAPATPAAPAPAPSRPSSSASQSGGGSSWNWGTSGGWGGGSGRTPSTRPAPAPSIPNAYGRYGWAPPPYAMNAPRRFGIWDGLFLWFMLDTLTRPGHAAFFHDNADDPGYRQWRAEADRQAQDNAGLRAKLDELDRTVQSQAGTPREAGRLPPDVPADLARADSADRAAPDAEGGKPAGSGLSSLALWSILLLGAAALFLLWRARRRRDQPAKPGAAQTAAPKPKAKGGSDVPLFGTLGNYVNQKLSGQRYSPSLFRLGMTVTIDPAPFLLAEGVTKVKAPDTGGDRLVSIDGVGTVTSGNATVHRLHMPDGGFLQIHLGPDGQPDECRYFTPIDSVTPADPGEWGFWLDGREGMIGWPEFQTKDGQLYTRVWSPGGGRIEPFLLSESLETLRGTETVVSNAMLYGRPTGAAAPAPEREYLLVAAVERNGRASVEIAAGIDVNPASLSLS